jgi:hypothetical protein
VFEVSNKIFLTDTFALMVKLSLDRDILR